MMTEALMQRLMLRAAYLGALVVKDFDQRIKAGWSYAECREVLGSRLGFLRHSPDDVRDVIMIRIESILARRFGPIPTAA